MEFQHRLYAYLRDKQVSFTMQHLEAPSATLARPTPASEWPTPTFVHVDLAFIGGQLTMLVIRDDQRIDLARLLTVLDRSDVTLADSNRLDTAFPDVELSAIPPLGELWGIPVYVDAGLARELSVCFYGGSWRDVVTLRRTDFDALADPTTLEFAVPREADAASS